MPCKVFCPVQLVQTKTGVLQHKLGPTDRLRLQMMVLPLLASMFTFSCTHAHLNTHQQYTHPTDAPKLFL
jgi:hypothetical protein